MSFESAAQPSPTCVAGTSGIGLRFPHLTDLLEVRPDIGLLEVHTENLFCLAPAVQRRIERLRADYAFSLHGVGLSLGSAQGVDETHLQRWADTVARYQPALISEHLSWNRVQEVSLPDLLPLPMASEALDVVARNVERTQEAIGREIAIENISAYLRYGADEMSEAEFLSRLVARTGCRLLVDVNNLHVNRLNLGEDPLAFLQSVPSDAVAEFHLAGPTRVGDSWIDTHAAPVPEAVWNLFEAALQAIGPRPTVVEWDQDLPALAVLLAEAKRADRYLDAARQNSCAA